jgi:sugar O-acyltransferase (sialic acid O-acetyltransferase NeuD family)
VTSGVLSKQALIILGASGHARVVLSAIQANGGTLRVCIAPAAPDPRWPAEIPWLGDDGVLERLDPTMTPLANGLGSIDDTTLRCRVYEKARLSGFRFPAIHHPAAFIDPCATLSEGAQVMAGAVVQTGARIGENATINTGARVDHDVDIGPHTHVAPGVIISGDARVGERVHIGTGAIVIQGITIGPRALVAAWAVVIDDV